MRRGVARVLFGSASVAFVLGPFTAAEARVPTVLPTPCVPTVSTIGDKTAFTFSAPDECTFTPPAALNGATYTILAVGGGGGGGAWGGGGGGGGEARLLMGYTAALNSKLVILTGPGGSGGIRTVAGASGAPAKGRSSFVWTVDPAATTKSPSPLLEASGGSGGSDNTTGSGGTPGTGGSGGTRLATGSGGNAPTATSLSGSPGEDGAPWTTTGARYGGGGGGGICANGSQTPSAMDPVSGGRDGGGASAGKRPAPVNYTSDGSDAQPGSGSGGGAGAGCANAFAGGASTANGGAGGRGTVVFVVTPTVSATTTDAPTTGTTTTVATSRTTTTLATSSSPTTLGGRFTAPRVTTTTVKTTTGTLKSTATTVATATAPATATSLPTGTTSTAPTTLSSAATTLAPRTQAATAASTAPETVTTPAAPEIVPQRPVFFGSARSASDFFEISFGATLGRPVRGASIRATATDLAPGSTVRAVLRSDPIVLGEFTVSPDGTVDASVVLPDDIPEGDHSLTFEAGSADGTPVSSVTVFSVDPSGLTESVVAAAETVGTAVDEAAIARSATSETPVYDTERHVARTAAIAATAAVVSSLAGMAVTQTPAGLGTSFPAPGAPSPPSSSPSSAPRSTGGDTSRNTSARREDEPGLDGDTESDEPALDDEPADEGDEEEDEISGTEADLLEDEISGTEADLLEDEDDNEVRPDRRGLWMLPGYAAVDRFLRRAVSLTSRRSVLATRILQDGHWLRASAGVTAALLWLAGFILGGTAALGLPGLVTAPATAVVCIVVAISLLDAMAGTTAWFGFALVALVTGNVNTLFDVRTLLGLGVIFVALPSIGSKFRPFTRAAVRRGDSAFLDRLGDYVIMPVLLAYTASTAYTALNGLSGLEMVLDADASTLLVVVLVAAYLRLLGEDVARVWYPLRSAEVRIPLPTGPGATARMGSVAIRAGLFLLVAAPFFGLGWRTWLMVGLVTFVPVLGLAEDRFPNLAVVHRFFPRGLLRFVVMMFATAWFGRFVLSVADNPVDARPLAVFMLLPGVLVGMIDLVGREGGEWQDSYPKRIAGLAVWLLAVAVLSGRIAV